MEDSRHTRTELPVDRRPAEEVQVGSGVVDDHCNDDKDCNEEEGKYGNNYIFIK